MAPNPSFVQSGTYESEAVRILVPYSGTVRIKRWHNAANATKLRSFWCEFSYFHMCHGTKWIWADFFPPSLYRGFQSLERSPRTQRTLGPAICTISFSSAVVPLRGTEMEHFWDGKWKMERREGKRNEERKAIEGGKRKEETFPSARSHKGFSDPRGNIS